MKLGQHCLLAFLILTCFSCKKYYTCKCTTSWTYQYATSYQGDYAYNTVYFKGNDSRYNQKLSKKQAKAACTHEQQATETNLTNGITDNGNDPLKPGESVITDCSLILN